MDITQNKSAGKTLRSIGKIYISLPGQDCSELRIFVPTLVTVLHEYIKIKKHSETIAIVLLQCCITLLNHQKTSLFLP